MRAHHPEHKECRIAEAEMIASFEAAFLKTETPALTGDYSSLFIGRLVDYPWLSQFLADSAYNDLEWDSKNGKPVTTGINLYVSHILFRHKLLASIEAALAKAGFRIIGVTVEKVLVGNFNNVPMYRGDQFRGSVPYDAQVWFKLKKFENS